MNPIGSSLTGRWRSWTPYTHAALRIVSGFLFIWPGCMKLFAYPMSMPGGGTARLLSQVGVGGVLEFFGGILVLLGCFTRPVAFILSGEMAVGYWQFHSPKGFLPIVNGGTDAVIFCFVFLYLSAAGAGPWSVDAARGKRTV